MRCYYPYVGYTPSAIPRPDQYGRLKSCVNTSAPVGTSSSSSSVPSLEQVLAVGNSAGTNDIVMNNQDITGANIIETSTIQLTDSTNTISSTGSGGNLLLTSTSGNINLSAGGIVNVGGAITVNGVAQFNNNVNIGSAGTSNDTPIINTYKSQWNIGTGGSGNINLECPLNVGGFGNINMTGSLLNMTGGAHINQPPTSTLNVLSGTNLTTNYGSTNTPSLKVFDGPNNQGVSVIPDGSAGAFNPLTSAGDVIVVGSGGVVNTKGLNLCSWSSTNSGIKITSTAVSIGSGGTTTTPTTGTTYDGTNITLTSPNPPLSTATQPATSDNSNKIPTTAWVQSLIATIPATNIIPYFYGESNNLGAQSTTPIGTISLNFSGGSWGTTSYFQARFCFRQEYTLASVNYYQNWTGVLQVYPSRVPTVTSTTACNIDNTIDGTGTNFSLTSTSAPNGRWYWVENYSNTGSQYTGGNLTPNPFAITATSLSSINFVIFTPLTTGSSQGGRITMFMEIINKGINSPITTSGVSTFFPAGQYYTSFGT
jgi:hypothetical protein